MRNGIANSVLALALLAGACGGPSIGSASGHLEELGLGDDPYPAVRGERCNLTIQNSEGSGILLVAFRDAAVVRADGQPVRLRFHGDNLRRGGRFEGGGVAIEIGGISPDMVSRDPPVGLPAVVGVRRGDSVEDFEATWTCGVRYPPVSTG